MVRRGAPDLHIIRRLTKLHERGMMVWQGQSFDPVFIVRSSISLSIHWHGDRSFQPGMTS
jgi:hypothetical protein